MYTLAKTVQYLILLLGIMSRFSLIICAVLVVTLLCAAPGCWASEPVGASPDLEAQEKPGAEEQGSSDLPGFGAVEAAPGLEGQEKSGEEEQGSPELVQTGPEAQETPGAEEQGSPDLSGAAEATPGLEGQEKTGEEEQGSPELARKGAVDVAAGVDGREKEGEDAEGALDLSGAPQGDDVFYYRKGRKVTLKVNTSKNFVLVESETNKDVLATSLKSSGAVMRQFRETKPLTSLNLIQEESKARLNWAIVDRIDPKAAPLERAATAKSVLYKAPFLVLQNGEEVGLSHLFYVKLKDASDRGKLEELSRQHNVTILGNNKFMPLWYTLSCSTKSSGQSLEVANKFFESGHFSVAEPDFLVDFQLQSANDEHFDQQWGFENTGQNGATAGIDIKACDAWSHSTGEGSIVVAVLDHGIELDHPDMPNISATSFDTVTGMSPSQVHGSHGTACAGIIGAARNNTIGVAGIAPDTTLMSISDLLTLGPNAAQRLANGLSWAWQNGAHVISNSWGHNALASALIDDAIDDALSQGRGGLGTVVVFAAGNANGPVSYPANSNPGILAVGAMSPCGERKTPAPLTSCDGETWWGSNFGAEIDVVAPGVLIPTTDRQGGAGYVSSDYTMNFNGTSAACPHVAGVAALVLSVSPALAQQDVVGLIEGSAQKVGVYNYLTTAGRNNGTWHEEMGYGLVDAAGVVLSNLSSGGGSRALGDFNGDGFDDLAIGVPGESIGSLSGAGAVNVIYGSSTGLKSAGDQLWHQNTVGIEGGAEAGDRLGASVSTGDFNKDGYTDLAIGVPGESIGSLSGAGAVNVIYGSSTGLKSAGDQLWHQNTAGIEGGAEAGDRLGASVS
ncbi:MAG: S8 family serine peptidase, partial [Gammaproteobacteria bacterium]|nr:S8 family serine peptidase [Gammaproteobacteria bacterium]